MKITYIIAIYNVKECLDECIQSVISDKSDTEIILVDDGSTDGPENLRPVCQKAVQDSSRASRKSRGFSCSKYRIRIGFRRLDLFCRW